MHQKKWGLVAAVALVAALTLGACGDKDDDGATGSSSGTSQGEGAVKLDQAGFFSQVSASQRKASTSHVSMKVGASGQTVSGEGDISAGDKPRDVAMSLTMDANGQSMKMRLVDETMYMNLGAATSNKFAKVDLTDESNPIGKQYNSLLKNLDPSGQLDQLKKSVTKFEQKGASKQLDGVKTTPYEVTVDTAKLADSLGGLGQGAANLPKSITYVMYIGPDKLPRRMTFDMAGTTMQMDYSKWGEKVDIAAPPASQVTDKNPFATAG